jgi:hypothetical protein
MKLYVFLGRSGQMQDRLISPRTCAGCRPCPQVAGLNAAATYENVRWVMRNADRISERPIIGK